MVMVFCQNSYNQVQPHCPVHPACLQAMHYAQPRGRQGGSAPIAVLNASCVLRSTLCMPRLHSKPWDCSPSCCKLLAYHASHRHESSRRCGLHARAPQFMMRSCLFQGVYGLVVNLGSLVVRTVLQPYEEAAFLAFGSQKQGSGGLPALQQRMRMLSVMVRAACVIGQHPFLGRKASLPRLESPCGRRAHALCVFAQACWLRLSGLPMPTLPCAPHTV